MTINKPIAIVSALEKVILLQLPVLPAFPSPTGLRQHGGVRATQLDFWRDSTRLVSPALPHSPRKRHGYEVLDFQHGQLDDRVLQKSSQQILSQVSLEKYSRWGQA